MEQNIIIINAGGVDIWVKGRVNVSSVIGLLEKCKQSKGGAPKKCKIVIDIYLKENFVGKKEIVLFDL